MKLSKKITFNNKVEVLAPSKFICLPMPFECVLAVKQEEEVNKYQKIGVCDNVFYFSPVSGYILDIITEKNEKGEKVKKVIIQNDFRDVGVALSPISNPDEIRQRLIDTGLNGIFDADMYSIYIAEDKYYINNDIAILNTYPDKIRKGVEIAKGFANLNTLDKRLCDYGVEYSSEQGKMITVEDILCFYEAVVEGVPRVQKVLSVGGGAVKTPKILRVAIGSEYGEILDACDGEVYPLKDYNEIYQSAQTQYAEVLDLKDELRSAVEPERSHIAKELIVAQKESTKQILAFLKLERKYKRVLLNELVYGDFVTGVSSEDFNQVVSFDAVGMLLLTQKEAKRRKKYARNKK